MTKVLCTPIGSTYTMSDFHSTVNGNTWAFWDDSWYNNAVLGQCFAFVCNNRGGESSRIIATGQIVGITKDTDDFVRHALLNWEAHQAGRNVLLLRMDRTTAFQGTFEDIFTANGNFQGTSNRTLKPSVQVRHNPFTNETGIR